MQVDEQAASEEHIIVSQEQQRQSQSKAEAAPLDEGLEGEDKENEQNVIQPSKAKFDRFKEEVKQRENTAMRNLSPQFRVDNQCELKDVVVFQDYSCKLTRHDLEFTATSRDAFVRMQLLERNDKKKWFLWIAEGKVGKAQIKTKIFDYYNKVDAISNFEKKFMQWTENAWMERDYFQPKHGKYVIGNAEREKQKLEAARTTESEILQILERVHLVHSPDSDDFPEVSAFDQSEVEPEIFELLQFAWDLNAFKQTFIDSQLDVVKLPLGVLTYDRIKKSFTILSEINKLLLKSGTLNATKEQQLADMTEHFYSTLPYDFGLKRPTNLDHLRRVKDKVKLMEVVGDICLAEKCLLNALLDLRERSPVQILQHELLTNLKPMNRSEALFDVIFKSVTNTSAQAHRDIFTTQIRHAYSLEKPSQKLSFMPFERRVHNKFLLWFGCRQTSAVANLREGLRLAPLEAPSTAQRFGKGIYLTDCFSRAASQCIADQSNLAEAGKQGMVFLVEVALGDMHWAHTPDPLLQMPPMAHSVYGVGAQKPDIRGLVDLRSTKENYEIDNDASDTKSQLFFNTGKMRSNPDMTAEHEHNSDQKFNDFVVFDPAQVKLRYAVLCDFTKTQSN